MHAPRYSYQAINTLALSDTGHFVFLDAWSISLLLSMLSQNMPLWFWENNQYPLSDAEIDDLENKLATAGGQLMHPIVGLIIPVCTGALPEGTLLCDGSTYLRADYPNLYDAIDAGLRIDADSFAVPDLRDRFVLGAGPTHAAYTSGGNFEHTQTVAEMPAHSHTSPPHSHSESAAAPSTVTIGLEVPVPAAVPAGSITGATAVSIDNTGGGAAMDITPPFYALKYVVVAL